MIAVMLLLSYSASAKELTEKENVLLVATEEKTEDVFLLVEAEKGVFFYLHCRKGINDSTGKYYYLWCRNERNGKVLNYLNKKDYPPIHELAPSDRPTEEVPTSVIEEDYEPATLPWE